MTKKIFTAMVAFLKWLRKRDDFFDWLEAIQFANRHNPKCPQYDMRDRTDSLIIDAGRFA